jgi:cytochrome P450
MSTVNPPVAMSIPTPLLRLIQLSPVYFPTDMLETARQIADKHGDVALVKIGPKLMYMISDPALVHEVLVEKADKFHKDPMIKRALNFTGNGLVVNEGDAWKKARRLAQPAFHHKRIDSYAQMMVVQTVKMLDTWHPTQEVGIFHEMMKTTLNIVTKALFSTDISSQVERIGELMGILLDGANDRLTIVPMLADIFPTPKNRRQAAALEETNALIAEIIHQRRQQAEDTGDLLSMLMLARDEGTDEAMVDEQLRDEIITVMLAGHETTATALTWTWYLLAQHPEVEAKLLAEIDTLGGRLPTMADLAQLPYTDMVVKESMRLYPPAGGVSRQAVEDVTIGSYNIPEGSTIAVSTYVMHRNARHFPDPERFEPERFSKERAAEIPKYAYLPFGAGPRVCIGNAFAMMEARLILAAVLQRYSLKLVPGQNIVPKQLFTTRPNQEIRMIIKQAAPEPQSSHVQALV